MSFHENVPHAINKIIMNSNIELSLEELNQLVSIHVKKINLMLHRNQISSEDLKYIRLASYPIAKRQWKLPPELAHLEEIYDATNPADYKENLNALHGHRKSKQE